MQKSMKDEVFIILTFLEEQASVEMGFYDLLQIAGHFSFSDHKSSNLTERQFAIFQCEIGYFEKSLPDHTPNFFVCTMYTVQGKKCKHIPLYMYMMYIAYIVQYGVQGLENKCVHIIINSGEIKCSHHFRSF